jgi:hypothetical protein
VFTSAVEALAAEDFDLVADCVDPAWLEIFAAELTSGERDGAGIEPEASTARDVFIRWLGAISPRAKVHQLLAERKITRDVAEAFCNPRPPVIPIELVGVVEEDDRFAHLLFRTRAGEPNESWLAQFSGDEREARRDQWVHGRVSVAEARRQSDGSWRLIPSRFFLGFDREHSLGLVDSR